jgi:GST-like protein
MLKFYYHSTPNPNKVVLFLEETQLAHDVVPVDTRRGEQHRPEFLKVNPNAKLPAIDDHGTIVFDSNAILLYLAEKHGQFLPPGSQRGATLSWLMFVATGVGPYSGQSVHFSRVAPKFDYAINRYAREVERHYRILNNRLADREYLIDSGYSIVDMALWGWANALPYALDDAAWAQFPHVQAWHERVTARPAAQRALQWRTRFSFKQEMDDDARRHLFPQNAHLPAA